MRSKIRLMSVVFATLGFGLIARAQTEAEFAALHRIVSSTEAQVNFPSFRGTDAAGTNSQVSRNVSQLERAFTKLEGQYKTMAESLRTYSSLNPNQQQLVRGEITKLSEQMLKLENLTTRLAESTQRVVQRYATGAGVGRTEADIKDSGRLTQLTERLKGFGNGTAAKNFMSNLKIAVSNYRAFDKAERATGIQRDFSTLTGRQADVKAEINRALSQLPTAPPVGGGVRSGRAGDLKFGQQSFGTR